MKKEYKYESIKIRKERLVEEYQVIFQNKTINHINSFIILLDSIINRENLNCKCTIKKQLTAYDDLCTFHKLGDDFLFDLKQLLKYWRKTIIKSGSGVIVANDKINENTNKYMNKIWKLGWY